MSDQGGDDAGETVGDESSSSRVRAPWSRKPPGEDPAEHSTLVGFMSVPVHRRFRLRRSTLLMAVAFVALGVVLYFNPTQSTSTVTVRGADGNYYQVPGAVLTAPTTTTTTTTRPPATTTTTSTLRSSTTTTNRSSTTTSDDDDVWLQSDPGHRYGRHVAVDHDHSGVVIHYDHHHVLAVAGSVGQRSVGAQPALGRRSASTQSWSWSRSDVDQGYDLAAECGDLIDELLH